MRYPTIFINHGGGPLPLMGRQQDLVEGMKDAVHKFLPKEPPSAIVVLSAHWESDPISITSSPNPPLYYDYYGFPPETYNYDFPAQGSPQLARQIQDLLSKEGLPSELDDQRGYDHGVFVPLMIMYPNITSLNVPVVQVSLHRSLDAAKNIKIGRALQSLRDQGVLILGSGYTFHNMNAFFHPSPKSIQASNDFNLWLKDIILTSNADDKRNRINKLTEWDQAPGARIAHPREEHLLPLLMVAAAGGDDAKATLIYDTTKQNENLFKVSDHGVTGYLFE